MGATENKEMIRTMFAELGKGNADAFLGAMSDDLKFTLIGTQNFQVTLTASRNLSPKSLRHWAPHLTAAS